jgi:hypothetical protein
LGLVLSTETLAVVVPSIGGMPATAGGMQCVAKSTFVPAAPAGQASAPPAVTASAVAPNSDAQRHRRDLRTVEPMGCPLLRVAGAAARLRRQGAIDVQVT